MADVHVGDVGTKYRIEVLDDGQPFDPSDAIAKEILFFMPGGVSVTKTATVETEVGPPQKWFLAYTVEDSSFHATSGLMKMRYRLTWINSTFTSQRVSVDTKGRELRILK